jgi:hypothetical protein
VWTSGRSDDAGVVIVAPAMEAASRRIHAVNLLLIALLAGATFAPTLRNGFLPLGFDDGLILDTVAIRALNWTNLRSLFTELNQAHYVPLTLLSFAIDYQLWGLDPFGYHLTNVLLQAVTGMLVYVVLYRLLGAAPLALLAALIFTVHPVQLEAVSLAVQRKTLLSGTFFGLTILGYREWRLSGRRLAYAGSVGAFLCAALAKPSVVTVPAFLLLYDYALCEGRVRILDKLPFVVIAVLVGWAAIAAHAAVGALHPPHGGSWGTNLLLSSRVLLEYVVALLLPVGLAPAYYYPPAVTASPLNLAALIVLIVVALHVTLQHRRLPWSFFCFWWFILMLLPESNLVPLAQLRADRFLYLAVVPFAVWLVVGLGRLDAAVTAGPPLGSRMLGPAFIGFLAVVCYASAPVWHDDVSAWRRVVERHPWCATAHGLLGRAYYGQGNLAAAEGVLLQALDLSEHTPPDVHRDLARVYAARGANLQAEAAARQALALAPDDAESVQLLSFLTGASAARLSESTR